MERRVKERLVGASILVVLVVLIVPELLSGPKPAALPAAVDALPRLSVEGPAAILQHVTMDLDSNKVPDTASAEPLSSPPSTTAPAPPPVVAVTPSAATEAPPAVQPAVETPTSSPTSVTAGRADVLRANWAVQLGSFASRVNSDKLLHQLKAQGFQVYELSGGSGRELRYRVRIGPLPDRNAAERTVAKLKSLGQGSSVIAPGH